MENIELFCFVGLRDTYKGLPRYIVGVAFEEDGNWHHFSNAVLEEDSVYTIIQTTIESAINKLTEMFESLKSITLVITPTSREEQVEELILRISNTETPYDKVSESLLGNKKLSKVKKEGLSKLALTFFELQNKNIKISCSALDLSKDPKSKEYKETAKTAIASLQADSAAAIAYYRHIKGKTETYSDVVTPKDLRSKVKNVPNLLTDNIIFNWLGDTRLPEGTLPASVYYTGNGELENKKPKGVVVDKVLSRGSTYFTGNNSRLRILGRLSAEDRYNVLILKEPAEYLEKVFAHQREVCKGIYSTEQMVAYRTRELLSGGVSNYIDDGNTDILGNSIHGDIFTLNCPRKDLSYVFNPPRLAFKIKRELETNQTRLIDHIKGNTEKVNMRSTDVTDVFFKDVDGKLKLDPEFTGKTKHIKFSDIKIPKDEKVIKLKALVKYDMPERNFMNKLIKDNPKVEVLTWMVDDYTVSYAFVITTNDGWLFYHAQYGSRHLLRGASSKARKE